MSSNLCLKGKSEYVYGLKFYLFFLKYISFINTRSLGHSAPLLLATAEGWACHFLLYALYLDNAGVVGFRGTIGL